MEEPEVRALRPEELDDVLPLIAGYQRFYHAQPDQDRNRAFFGRFIEPSEEGLLLGAWSDGELVGFATLYWTHSSTKAADIVLLNDLFVAPEARGGGVGRALIEASAAVAAERGAAHLEWYTATDNRQAQALYEGIPGVSRSAWFAYEVDRRTAERG